ncbi:23707_t:CDS:2 [Dentiscutata erythropus]|uniref:23707_t:CDS:1 n=1 Tax=Dentiscutata erythropus TaxID=1348616 RepID=A0A9N9NT58_9GLOM|nr:23707_t:CDS:2 [Dentiscutata erythropus]
MCHRSAIYRSNEEEFRELTYKDFITQKFLITKLEKNSIVLIIGRYVFEDAKYLTLVQTVLISTSSDEIEITPDDLSYSSSLLLFSASVISNFHFSNSEFGRESLMLSKKLYNGITGYKNIESEVINYASNEQTSNNTNKEKAKAQSDINDHLEEKNNTQILLPTSPSKPQKTEPQKNNPKLQNNKSTTDNFYKL